MRRGADGSLLSVSTRPSITYRGYRIIPGYGGVRESLSRR